MVAKAPCRKLPAVFGKLNLQEQEEILVLDAPADFEQAIEELDGIRVQRHIEAIESLGFALSFVTRRAALSRLATALAAKATADALLWFAYPKGKSKNYACDFNRDDGWNPLHQLGFDSVRQVAIDSDWSALRFRRVEFIRRSSK